MWTVIFTAQRSYASAVLGVVILSVRLSHTCFVTNPKNLPAIFLYYMKQQTFSFSATQQWLVGNVPLHLKWAIEVTHPFKNRPRCQLTDFRLYISTVRASEKSSIMTNRKSYMGFPTSYSWSAYVTSKSPKGWLKSELFLCLNKTQLQLNEVCYKVSLRENFQEL